MNIVPIPFEYFKGSKIIDTPGLILNKKVIFIINVIFFHNNNKLRAINL